MRKWMMALSVFVGSTIFVGHGAAREWDLRRTPPAASVSGRLRVVSGGASGALDMTDAVIYLEPIEPSAPPPVVAAPAPSPSLPARRAPDVAPAQTTIDTATLTLPTATRDTASVLWGAVHNLQHAVRALAELFTHGQQGADSTGDARASGATRADSARTSQPARPTAPPPQPHASPAEPPRAIPEVAIEMREKEFRPHVRVVEAGGTVQFPNRDPFSHNVFSNAAGAAFDAGLYPRGESRGAAFRRPGSYPVFCNIHSRMSSFVVAVPTPYHAQPDRDGRFEIPSVPPGRYRLHAWHERATAPGQVQVTVTERGAAGIELALNARPARATTHLNKFGQPYPSMERDEY